MHCPYCNEVAEFLTSKEFYGRDYGTNIYVCKPCDAYVGTNGNTKKALGTLAKRELRELRKRAHFLFDPLWRQKKMTRNEAYKWLQKNMDLSPDKAHIGMFNEEQCKELIQKIKTYRNIK